MYTLNMCGLLYISYTSTKLFYLKNKRKLLKPERKFEKLRKIVYIPDVPIFIFSIFFCFCPHVQYVSCKCYRGTVTAHISCSRPQCERVGMSWRTAWYYQPRLRNPPGQGLTLLILHSTSKITTIIMSPSLSCIFVWYLKCKS